MWICPYCGGKTKPISIKDVDKDMRSVIENEMKAMERPVIVKCESCKRIWVDEL